MIGLRLLGLLALVAVNGFFAAVEFSLVAVRHSRVRQLVDEGRFRAKIVLELIGKLDRVVSGVQVGITLTSLGLGALGESTLASALSPLVANIPGRHTIALVHAVSLVVAFLFLTTLHVVLGELVPKSMSLQRAERVALLVAPPFQWYLEVFRPAINLLDGASRWVLRGLGFSGRSSHTQVHSAEELQIQIQQARERGLVGMEEEKFILGAIELDQMQVRELMVPRPDVHFVTADATLDDVMRVFVTTQRSRLPVFEGTGEQVLGYIHIKDIVWVLLDRERRAEEGWTAAEFNVRSLLHEMVIVPESKPVSELLLELRTSHGWMAMVVDEFGTILGLLTLEDILEQLVGEIHDEFDVVEKPVVVGQGADAATIFDASLGLRDLESQYNIILPEDRSYATVGGFVLARLGFIPRGGESFDFDGYRFTVVEMDRRRVARVKIQRLKTPLERGAPATAADAKPAAEKVLKPK
ncbi:MAG TPA: hemolysin family protein [Candidatus Acidoferrales bacterium]|nr:hemolysin family protein [Candidatus Acidoferrales bacterium]